GLLVPFDVATVTFATPAEAVIAITKVAVIWVVLTTATLLMVTPALLMLTMAPERKFVPVKVTGTVAPMEPMAGLIEVRVGAEAAVMLNATAVAVPPEVVTVTLIDPVGVPNAIDNVAVIWVELTTLTLLTVTPVLLTPTLAPETKLVPVKVIGTTAPCTPVAGVIELRVGGGGATLKLSVPLVPPDVDTLTATGPIAAVGAMTKVAVIWLVLTTFTLLTVTSELLTFTVAP